MHFHGEEKIISVEELKKKLGSGRKPVVVEVLGKEEFERGHIPSAINIPVDELEERAEKELDRSKEIVVYCSSFSCHASGNAAHLLYHLGYENVSEFSGGKRAWEQAGFPLEKS